MVCLTRRVYFNVQFYTKCAVLLIYLENNKLAIPSFRFMFIPVDNVLKTLRHLNVSKGAGLDKIPAKMLRIAADIIAPSFPLYF
jgi:hypothetical protein